MPDELLDAALYYAGIGCPVFPCAFDKRPVTLHGCKDATVDPQTIRNWWAKQPAANVGLSAEGLLVIDVDAPGCDLALALGGLCPTQQTPRGGRHFVFRRPAGKSWRNSQSKLAPKVDVRTAGGYILAAPSRTKDGEYIWLDPMRAQADLPEPPDWLADMLDALDVRPAAAPASPAAPASTDVETRAVAYLDAMPSAISGAGGHGRTFDAARAVVYGFALGPTRGYEILDAHFNPRCEPPWSGKDLRRKCDQAETTEFSKPRGWLLDQNGHAPHADLGVDLTGIMVQMRPLVEVAAPAPEPIGPIPPDLLRCPGFIDSYIEYCMETATYRNPAMAFCGALSLLSCLTGRKVRTAGNVRPNIYLLGLADASSGKERPRAINREIMLRVDKAEMIQDEFASPEGLQDALFQNPVMLAQIDEMHGFLKGLVEEKSGSGQKFIDTLLKLYTTSESYFKMRQKAGKKAEIINQPSLTMFGTGIPAHFFKSLSKQLLENGFFARLLIVESGIRPRNQTAKLIDIPEFLMDAVRHWSDFSPGGNLSAENPDPAVIPESPAAIIAIADCRDAADDEYDRAVGQQDEAAKTVWGRAGVHVAKLSLLAACSERYESPEIEKKNVLWARDFVWHQINRMLSKAKDHVSENDFDALCNECILHVKKSGGVIGRSSLLRKTHQSVKVFDEIVKTLISQERLVSENHQPKIGRPGVIYRTSFPIHSQ